MNDSSNFTPDEPSRDGVPVPAEAACPSGETRADAVITVNLGHYLGMSDLREHATGYLRSEWKEHFVTYPVVLPRPDVGVLSTVVSCPQCGAVHVGVASRRAVRNKRLASGFIIVLLVMFDIVIYFTFVRPGNSSTLAGLLAIAALLTIIPILNCVRTLTQSELDLALLVIREVGGKHKFFRLSEKGS